MKPCKECRIEVSNKEERKALVEKLQASGLTKSEFFRRPNLYRNGTCDIGRL